MSGRVQLEYLVKMCQFPYSDFEAPTIELNINYRDDDQRNKKGNFFVIWIIFNLTQETLTYV